ncbi:hypothetical protein ERO13_D05G260500v2 [Gossypium hirsutum]|nr:hypothetical protein ERO13_D05G260500v2 [Gossypium hirsutum]
MKNDMKFIKYMYMYTKERKAAPFFPFAPHIGILPFFFQLRFKPSAARASTTCRHRCILEENVRGVQRADGRETSGRAARSAALRKGKKTAARVPIFCSCSIFWASGLGFGVLGHWALGFWAPGNNWILKK